MVERIGEVAYRVQLPPSLPHHPVFHVSLLQADKQRDPQLQSAEGWEPVEQEEDAENSGLPAYEVEFILDERGSQENKEYLVKWKGFPEAAATWEPEANLDNCAAMLRAFRAGRKRQRRDPPALPPSQQ